MPQQSFQKKALKPKPNINNACSKLNKINKPSLQMVMESTETDSTLKKLSEKEKMIKTFTDIHHKKELSKKRPNPLEKQKPKQKQPPKTMTHFRPSQAKIIPQNPPNIPLPKYSSKPVVGSAEMLSSLVGLQNSSSNRNKIDSKTGEGKSKKNRIRENEILANQLLTDNNCIYCDRTECDCETRKESEKIGDKTGTGNNFYANDVPKYPFQTEDSQQVYSIQRLENKPKPMKRADKRAQTQQPFRNSPNPQIIPPSQTGYHFGGFSNVGGNSGSDNPHQGVLQNYRCMRESSVRHPSLGFRIKNPRQRSKLHRG